MNKQELASEIWRSANSLRGKIPAEKYKDLFLGFVFYKFISDMEERYAESLEFNKEELLEDDDVLRDEILSSLGYFISYDHLFSTWIEGINKNNFSFGDVTDSITAYNQIIEKYDDEKKKKNYANLFDNLADSLTNMGGSLAEKTKSIKKVLKIVDKVPTTNKQDYDVLGFIYEYLLSNFASAANKAGEFYTPFEVSRLMGEIITHHLKDKESITVFDSCSGSGSLLLNIGKCFSKYNNKPNSVYYYAQELKPDTYNLTRMNLIMRRVSPDNFTVRNGDTLGRDWPFFEMDDNSDYEYRTVDAVVSNPPYSQSWTRPSYGDPRFDDYGYAPKSKADYAFLLHDLYHLKKEGLMTIVLPHGVLFRGKVGDNSEGQIRKTLVDKNFIDVIIGLPSNIFFNTSIPTIIMVLNQNKKSDDILFIDASKGFEKSGKHNRLRDRDIRKIIDVIDARADVKKFSRKVSKEEIEVNQYNLNIPRYVDSSQEPEHWDIYSIMNGKISNFEFDQFEELWNNFPSLKNELIQPFDSTYNVFKNIDVKETILNNEEVKDYFSKYNNAFNRFDSYLFDKLISNYGNVDIVHADEDIYQNILGRIQNIDLVDQYEIYQALEDGYTSISNDIQMMQMEGFEATKQIDELYEEVKDNDKEEDATKEKKQPRLIGYKGHILPFTLVQKTFLSNEYNELLSIRNSIEAIDSDLEEIKGNLTDDNDGTDILNEDQDDFDSKKLEDKYKQIVKDIETEETKTLNEYLLQSKKKDKVDFISSHNNINWNEIKSSNDGTYSRKEVDKYIFKLKSECEISDDNSFIVEAYKKLSKKKELNKQLKLEEDKLLELTKQKISSLTKEEVEEILKQKWINPLMEVINRIPLNLISQFSSELNLLKKKYDVTFPEIEDDIEKTSKELLGMLDDLDCDEYDRDGLDKFKLILGGKNDE